MHRKLALGATLLTLAGVLSSPVSMVVAKADVTDPGFTAVCTDDGSSDNGNSASSPSTSAAGSGGAWSQKGTQAYNTAQQIFKYWTSKHGFSGAAAAGIVGNVAGAEDPSMKLDQKQLGGGTGGGLYQFTPYTKYLQDPVSDKSWSVENQGDVVFDLELKNNAIKNYGLHLTTAQIGELTDPKKAAEAWEAGYERPKSVEATLAKRQAAAEQAYNLFGGANIQANSALLGAASAAAGGGSNGGASSANSASSSDNPDCPSNGNSSSGSGQADGDIVKIARSMMGWFHYPNPDRHNVQMCTKDGKLNSKDDLNKDGQTDCSGFVWIVLKLAGYSVPPAMGWYTKTMAEDAKGPHKWFKQIDPKDAKPGDVIIVNEGDGAGANGHTAIITSNWQGYDNTKCINEGGDDETVFHNNGVCEDTIRKQFWTMLDNGDVTIAEPVKASNGGK